MEDEGFSTIVDAILFLLLAGACAVILGPVISGHGIERSASDRGLREIAADTLCSLETERADYFEYRVLGDVADRLAETGGINASGDILYKDLTRALLGRGTRHMTIMDLAAGDAACQFIVEFGDVKVRANPVTSEYDRAISALIDRAVRSGLDSRYRYAFTLRWKPLAGIPLAGEARAGEPCPPGAVSSSVQVCMPYTTDITWSLLEQVNKPDLDGIDQAISEYRSDGDEFSLRRSLGNSMGRCLKNSTALALGEIWNHTMGSQESCRGSRNPLNVLDRFIDGKVPDTTDMIGLNVSVEDAISKVADLYCQTEADDLAGFVAGGVVEGSLDVTDAREKVLDWLFARYRPSGAVATISVWTGAYAGE